MTTDLTIQEVEQLGLEQVDDHLQDWCAFAEEVFGVYLDEEQKAILRSVQHNPKTVVKSGTARGKDFVTAVAVTCFLYLTPEWNAAGELTGNTKVAMTAPTDRQVGNIMYPEVVRLVNRARGRGFNLPGRLTGYDIRMEDKEWFLTGFKADDKATEAWTGFHAVNVMFAVTEASGMSEEVFNAIEGNLQGNSRLLIVFNDNTGTGYAANAMKKPEWAKFRLDSLNAPNVVNWGRVVRGEITEATYHSTHIPGQVDWQWVDARVRDWCEVIPPSDFLETEGDFWWQNDTGKHCYRPNDLFRVKIRGMAPKVSQDILVPLEWIEAAQERWKTAKRNPSQPLRLGVDVAGMGRDSSSFCHRHGDYVEKFDLIQSGGVANHMQVAGLTKTKLEAATNTFNGVYPQAFVDTIGEGAGVYSRLQELEIKGVFSVKAGEAAKDGLGNPYKDATGVYTFKNMRSYLYWAVRDWLNPRNGAKAMLPPGPDYRGLTDLKWNMRSDGSIELESKDELKKRIGKSPDEEDSLAITFYPVADIDGTVRKAKTDNYYPL